MDVILIQQGSETLLVRVDEARRCPLGLLDELARRQLVARRFGWTIVLAHTSPPFASLIDAAGLADVLPTRP